MPPAEPSLGSLELNEVRLYKKWKDYLDIQSKRLLDNDLFLRKIHITMNHIGLRGQVKWRVSLNFVH